MKGCSFARMRPLSSTPSVSCSTNVISGASSAFPAACSRPLERAFVDLVKGALYPAVTDKQVFSQSIPWVPLTLQRKISGGLRVQLAAVEKARQAAQAQIEEAEHLRRCFRTQIMAELESASRVPLSNLLLGIEAGKSIQTSERLATEQELAVLPKQRVIGRIMTAVEKIRVDSETNLCDILDRVTEISIDHIDDRHFFTLSQVYEDLLLKMGEKNSDGGQFFTPREVIRAMVRVIDPHPGETIYDPGCGTGGFLAQSYELLEKKLGTTVPSTELGRLKHDTFYGREKENLVFPIALANLVLHGIDQPNLWHGNTLSNTPTYAGLFDAAPDTFDVVLTNPPFGGKEGKDAQKNFSFETSSTQVLFLQHILSKLRPPLDGKPGGRCGAR